MLDSFLSQEEIQALIKQVKAEDSDDNAEILPAEGEAVKAFAAEKGRGEKSYRQKKGLSETCKVVFNRIEPKLITRKDPKIEELNHVTFNLKVVLGETVLTVGELLNLKRDSVIVLDRLAGENARLLVNGKPLADGEIVVLNDCFAFRVNFMEDRKREPARKQVEGEEREQ